MDNQLSVRELQVEDIPHIIDYWLKSDDEYLISLGVDLKRLPTRDGMTNFLTNQISTPFKEKMSYALIWCLDGEAIGQQSAKMHLHLWNTENRHKGIGTFLIKKSLPFFFENLKLKELWSEPYALNPAPNKTLEKIGFEFQKKYTTIPGSINFEQEVNQWKLTKEQFKKS